MCEEEAALHPVNLNTASSAELQQVPGIGPATADKILQTRKSYGKFKSVNDLEAIRGIAPKKLDKMKKYLTVGTSAPSPQKPATQPKATGKTPPPKNLAAKPKPAPKTSPPTASEDEEP